MAGLEAGAIQGHRLRPDHSLWGHEHARSVVDGKVVSYGASRRPTTSPPGSPRADPPAKDVGRVAPQAPPGTPQPLDARLRRAGDRALWSTAGSQRRLRHRAAERRRLAPLHVDRGDRLVRIMWPRWRGVPGRREMADGPLTEAPHRYVVVNGYGADPATRTDRFLLERDPYVVIEGAVIAAFAIRASEAIIAVRAGATEAIRRLESAIGAAATRASSASTCSAPDTTSRSPSGSSRAPTTWARRPSC